MLVLTLYSRQLSGLSWWRNSDQMHQVGSNHANATYIIHIIRLLSSHNQRSLYNLQPNAGILHIFFCSSKNYLSYFIFFTKLKRCFEKRKSYRKVWLLPFYNLINDSMMAAGTRRSMGEANGDNNAVTVDISNCL